MNPAFAVADYRAPELRAIPWNDFLSEFLGLYAAPMKSPNTLRHTVYTMGLLSELGVQSTADLTTAMLASLVTSHAPGRSPNTVRSRLRVVQAACTYAEKCGYVRISPFRIRGVSTWMRPSPPRGIKCHLWADVQKVLAFMEKAVRESAGWDQWRARRLWALTAFLCGSGVRAGEAYHCQIEDLDLSESVAFIHQRDGYRLKTVASEEFVGLPTDLVALLREEWLPFRLSAPDGVEVDQLCPWLFPNLTRTGSWSGGCPGLKPRDRMKTVGRLAGVDGFTPLSCRHSLITQLDALGQGEGVIRNQARHTNVTTQRGYKTRKFANLRAGVSGITF
jgi:integrase